MEFRFGPAIGATLLGALLLGSGPDAVIGQANRTPDPIPLAELAARLEAAGYANITLIDAESGGRYEFEGLTTHGRRFEIFVDGRTGAVAGEVRDFLPASELIRRLDDARLSEISRLEAEPFGRYEVHGRAVDGKRFEAFVDRETGEITEDR